MSQPPGHDVRETINALDLKAVMNAAKEVHQWTGPEARAAERRYRDFLWVVWNSANNTVPELGRLERFAAFSRSVDEVWHTHILWTDKYREDCERVFGKDRFLDHLPVYAADVRPSDIEASIKLYEYLGLTPPPDSIEDCVWSLVCRLDG